jgi:hypothetical protein
MAMPGGLVQALGDDGPSEEGSDSTDDESMLEQHLKAFKRALDGGNFSKAAESFKSAMDECSTEPDSDDSSPDDSGTDDSDEY